MASEIAALRARVQTLESENGKLVSTLRKQESASRTMTESLQSELARIQHLCNELSYTMVLQGVDPSVLSAVTSKHLRFDPAVHQVRAAATAAGGPSTPRSAQQKEVHPAAISAASKSGSSALEVPFPLAAPAPAALPTAAYQLAPVPAPARAGTQFRGVNATPPEAFIPDSLRKRLDASSALATRLGSPAMFGNPDDQLASSTAGGGERVFLTGAPTTLNAAFDAAAASDAAHLKPSPPPFAGEHGAEEGGYDGAPTPPRGNSASDGRRTHSRGRRLVPSPMNPGLDPQPAGCS